MERRMSIEMGKDKLSYEQTIERQYSGAWFISSSIHNFVMGFYDYMVPNKINIRTC